MQSKLDNTVQAWRLIAMVPMIILGLTSIIASGGGGGGDNQIDTDTDGIFDSADNCPLISNANQSDSDGDGAGDACDQDLGWDQGNWDEKNWG